MIGSCASRSVSWLSACSSPHSGGYGGLPVDGAEQGILLETRSSGQSIIVIISKQGGWVGKGEGCRGRACWFPFQVEPIGVDALKPPTVNRNLQSRMSYYIYGTKGKTFLGDIW
ncbi:unnamed protein product [Victoria cruziana]